MNYVGDYPAGATVIIYFNTFDSNDPSASVTMTNFANTDVHIHKGSSLTQRNNAAGVTVDVDVDAIAGSHFIEIDTSDNTVADFFTAGADYNVRIEGTTVDGATVNAVVGSFSLDNRAYAGRMHATSIATLASQTSFTLTTGSADNDAYNNCIATVTDIATGIQKAVGLISDYAGGTLTVTLAADPGIFTMAAGDNISICAASSLANVRSWNSALIADSLLTSDDIGMLHKDTIGTVTSQTVFIMDTNIVTINEWLGHTVSWFDASTAARGTRYITAINETTNTITINAAFPGSVVLAGDTLRVYDEIHPSYALSTYDPASLTVTDTIIANILSAAKLICRRDVANTTDEAAYLGAINDDGGSGSGSYGPGLHSLEQASLQAYVGIIQTVDSQTVFSVSPNLQPDQANTLIGCTFQIKDASTLAVDYGYITAVDVATEKWTIDSALAFTIATNDIITIFPFQHPEYSVAAILADTNELQGDWADGGRLDLLLDATLADTNELQTDWTNAGRLDVLLDAIKAKTDSLTFTLANKVDANALAINSAALVGDGNATPWDGA